MRYVSDSPAFAYSMSQLGCYIVVVMCRFPREHCSRMRWSMYFCSGAHVKIACATCLSTKLVLCNQPLGLSTTDNRQVPFPGGTSRIYIFVLTIDCSAHQLTFLSYSLIPIIMPRRPPPSALRLFQGPLPPRSEPKHRLPSVPSPTFYPKGALPRQPSPPPGVKPNFARVACSELTRLGPEISMYGPSPTSSPCCTTKRRRGPWDDSSSLDLHVDVDSLLAVPKPVVVCAY